MKALPFLTRKIAFLNFILYLCVCFACMNLCARRGYRYPQKPEDLLELELKVVVNYLI